MIFISKNIVFNVTNISIVSSIKSSNFMISKTITINNNNNNGYF